jgi:hypothetical protein
VFWADGLSANRARIARPNSPDVNQATGLIEGVFGHLLRAAAVHVEPPFGIARKYRLRRSTGFASA